MMSTIALFTLPVYSGTRNGTVSVRLSVSSIDSQQAAAATLRWFAAELRARYRSIAVGAVYRLSIDLPPSPEFSSMQIASC